MAHELTICRLLAELGNGHVDEHLRGGRARQLLLLEKLLNVAILAVENQIALAATQEEEVCLGGKGYELSGKE
jgi:hypothetical protein